MPTWRDHIRLARATVHRAMRVRAVYLPRVDGVGLTVHVRPRARAMFASVEEGTTGLPQMHDTDTRLLFDRAEVHMPAVNATVLVSPDEGYKIRAAKAPQPTGYIEADVSVTPAALWTETDAVLHETDPVCLAAPSIAVGTGNALVARAGLWTGAPRPFLSFEWLVNDDSAGSGATFGVGGLNPDDVVTLVVTATNLHATVSRTSLPHVIP